MGKLSVGFIVLFLPIVVLFQNCGKQGATALSGDTATDDVEVKFENEADETSSGTIRNIDFGYDSDSQGFLYNLDLKARTIVNAQGDELKTLSNSELSTVVNIVAGNRLIQGKADSSCAIENVGQPIFAQLNMSDDTTQFVLNTASSECGLVNFVDSGNQMLDLSGVLGDFQAEVETP